MEIKLNELVKIVNDEMERERKNPSPNIFTHTIYRLPTHEELIELNNHQLTADEIISGFKYTIIGRGIKTEQAKKMIHQSILMLSKLYPQNNTYKEALDKISQEYGQMNENRLIEIINEEISAIRKDKNKEIFDYHGIANQAWDKKNKQAQEFQRINFDLENDDSTGEKKTFYVKKNLRKDQPIKDEFNAELMEAGGDWEMPVLYFRLELTHQYGLLDNKYESKPEYVWDLKEEYGGLSNCYVLIPSVEAGNKLVKGESDSGKYDWFAYQNSEMSDEEEKLARITDADKRKAWQWLQDLLLKLVNDRHEMLDD